MKVFKCEGCGKMLLTMQDSGCTPRCCGEPMTLLEAGATDGALEKHVPAVTVEGNTLHVQVGEVEHPMMEAHSIQWIAVETAPGPESVEGPDAGSVQIKYLKPGMKPAADFVVADPAGAVVYEYCNLHGLWKKEL